ncbi:MAG: ABC transporter substrate-binding protein [Clostridiales bacterium]|nr:ABC transporter substrate-binding protein [Clostridiales bacterium]
MKSRFKRAVCLILSVCLMGTAAACSGEPEETETTTLGDAADSLTTVGSDTVLQLSFSKSDSLNPFYAQPLGNQTLQTLIFDSLFRLDEAFAPQMLLAEEIDVDGTLVSVTIRQGVLFSDGSALTAEDVQYSYQLAKDAPAYADNLAAFSGVSVQDAYTVRFQLREDNPNAAALLTFPVAKSQTAGKAADQTPVGSGRYAVTQQEGEFVLYPNTYRDDFVSNVSSIELLNVENQDSIDNALKIGNISFTYKDLSEGKTSNVNANTQKIPLLNLVYLGLNSQTLAMRSATLRRAASYAVNREELVNYAYAGYAVGAVSVFHPNSALSADTEIASEKADNTAARTALSQGNYGGETLTLLVNSENAFRVAAADLVAKHLNAQGFQVQVSKASFSDYEKRLKSGDYDLYIGEIRLTDDMDLSPFFSSDGAARYGIDLDGSDCVAFYEAWRSGEGDLAAFSVQFQEEMPFVPLVYRSGMVGYTNRLSVKPASHYGDVFSNVEEWSY